MQLKCDVFCLLHYYMALLNMIFYFGVWCYCTHATERSVRKRKTEGDNNCNLWGYQYNKIYVFRMQLKTLRLWSRNCLSQAFQARALFFSKYFSTVFLLNERMHHVRFLLRVAGQHYPWSLKYDSDSPGCDFHPK